MTTETNSRTSGNVFRSAAVPLKSLLRVPAGIPSLILIILVGTFCILSIPGVVEGFYFIFTPDPDGPGPLRAEFTERTLINILNGSVLTGIIVIAVVMLMINGEFDLSVGPILAMGGYIFGTLSIGGAALFGLIDLGEPLNPVLALLLTLAGCALLGAVNGFIVTLTRIPSFIATLGTMFIFLWLISVYSDNQAFEASRATIDSGLIYNIFGGQLRDFIGVSGQLGRLSTSVFWMIGLAILMHIVMTKTRYGNRIFAVGGNIDAANAQGINIKIIKISGFTLTGLFAGIAGIVLFSQFGRVQGNSGNMQELQAIAAAVVGGTLLTGGYGSVIGGLIGILTISTLRSGVVLLSTPIQNSFINDIPVAGEFIVRLTSADNFLTIVGFTIVGAAVLNSYIRRRI